MKTWVLHRIGDLQLEDRPTPRISDGEVLVEVKMAGICGSDISRIFKTEAHVYPLIPGHEFAGVVVETGKNTERWKNKRVSIFPLVPCYKCDQCKNNRYEMCCCYDYIGSRRNGGFAQYVVVPEWNLIEIPDAISMEQAALMEPMAVAAHAIRRAGVHPKNSIAVCGLGTIGLFIVMFLREMGCENIFGIGKKKIQKELFKRIGVADKKYICIKNRNVDEAILSATNGLGVDMFFECVGKNETISLGLKCTAASGCIQLVGNPMDDIVLLRNIYWKILRKQLTVLGTWNSSFTHELNDDWHYVLNRLECGAIHPERMITHKYNLSKLDEGVVLIRDKKEEYVKVMINNYLIDDNKNEEPLFSVKVKSIVT